MAKKKVAPLNEFECPGCKEKLPLGSKNCKWCGMYIANPPTTSIVEKATEKKSFFGRAIKKD